MSVAIAVMMVAVMLVAVLLVAIIIVAIILRPLRWVVIIVARGIDVACTSVVSYSAAALNRTAAGPLRQLILIEEGATELTRLLLEGHLTLPSRSTNFAARLGRCTSHHIQEQESLLHAKSHVATGYQNNGEPATLPNESNASRLDWPVLSALSLPRPAKGNRKARECLMRLDLDAMGCRFANCENRCGPSCYVSDPLSVLSLSEINQIGVLRGSRAVVLVSSSWIVLNSFSAESCRRRAAGRHVSEPGWLRTPQATK